MKWALKKKKKKKIQWILPDPPWPEDGPVDADGVEPDESVQSKSSEEDWFHPEHNPLSNEHHTKHVT